MYPPILVLLLALVSICNQTSALELQEDVDGRESYDYSSPYAGTGSLLGYGSTGAMEEPVTGVTVGAPELQAPAVLLATVYYQHPPKELPEDYAAPVAVRGSSSEEERVNGAGVSFNSSEVTGDDLYLTTSAVEGAVFTERNDSAEHQPEETRLTPADHEARASVPLAFLSDRPNDDASASDDRSHHRPSQEEPMLGSRSLEHHHHSHEAPSEATNFLYSGTSDDHHHHGQVANESSEQLGSDVSRRFDSSDASDDENSVEDDSQEEETLAIATTTGSSFGAELEPPVAGGSGPHKPSPYPSIDDSKISKTELLARLIGDRNLRMPIAFLVDASNDSLAFTKRVLDVSLVPKTPLDAILMSYNGTGVSNSNAFRNTKSLMDAVNSLKPIYNRGGSEYSGICRTSQEVPYDSAIFLATSKATSDPQQARTAAIALLKKRIRLYIIWFGDEMDTSQRLDNQTALHELAYKTGGRVIHFDIDRYFGNNPLLTTLTFARDLHGSQSIPISVGEDVSSLYFKMRGHLDKATLEAPHGSIVVLDLLRKGTQHKCKWLERGGSPSPVGQPTESTALAHRLPIYLCHLNVTLGPGVYRLNISSNDPTGYSVAVKTPEAIWLGIVPYDVEPDPAMAHGWEHEGTELLSNNLGGETHLQRSSGGSSKLPRSSGEEHRFARQTELTDEDSGIISGRASIQAITKVDVGVNSQLIGSRGQTLQLYFEVTNYRQTPITYFFRVTDELAFLRSLNPGQATLSPGQSINVIVTLVVAPAAEIGSRDKVTFSTTGVDQVSQSAWVTVSDSAGLADTTRPSLWYTYSSRCEYRSTPATCTGAFWTLEVMARDYETGLMRISSSPAGLLYKTPFTAGTRDEVRASYTASCCQPRVTVTAYDVSRNVRSLNLDVTDIWLNEAGIAAVVLGVLLFIALVILLVLLVRYCIRKRRQSKELPIYRGAEPLSTRRTK
ncbi:uncharacterized protein LOC128274051 [Anopheles cruzii]|uniref:uncharacterized protein LOC128274051 n=1 Tax=Anopheles cruzii TaxID=68878 RepID=UPI0022EC5DD1|nr:uncharacterized protein LOC128274051 [Anopheles cruzii]